MRASCIALLTLFVPIPSQAQVVPQSPQIGYQGRLLKEGAPPSGAVTFTFSLYSQANGGTSLWSEEQTLALTDGYYATYLGSGKLLSTGDMSSALALDESPRYLQVTADGVDLKPRQLLGTVPYAMSCSMAKSVAASVARVRLTANDQLKDLGDILKPLLAKFHSVEVTLPANTDQWKWNVPISLDNDQDLKIVGEGYTNGACDITAVISMNKSGTRMCGATETRTPERAAIGRGSRLTLEGLKIVESSSDSRPTTCDSGGALFNMRGMSSVIEIMQTKIITTESVVGVGTGAFANIRFGHTRVEAGSGLPAGRTVYASQVYQGWEFGPGVAFVHNTHYKLVNAAFGADARRLFYTTDSTASELWASTCIQ